MISSCSFPIAASFVCFLSGAGSSPSTGLLVFSRKGLSLNINSCNLGSRSAGVTTGNLILPDATMITSIICSIICCTFILPQSGKTPGGNCCKRETSFVRRKFSFSKFIQQYSSCKFMQNGNIKKPNDFVEESAFVNCHGLINRLAKRGVDFVH